MSIASEIQRLQNAKTDIKEAIENKGVSVGNDLIDTYAEKINQIQTGTTPTGNINITENGTYDVTDKATATVNVVGGGTQYPIIEGDGEHEVRFVDYDGTLIKVQYVNDGENATAPTLPTHERLTFVEWNRDFTNVKHDLDVGALYKTKSLNTELFIEVTEETGLGMTLTLYRNSSTGGNIIIDWGDGETSSIPTSPLGQKTLIHNYSSYGSYMISINSNDTNNYNLNYNSSTVLLKGSNETNVYRALKKCYCGSIGEIKAYCFYNAVNLEELSWYRTTKIDSYAFVGTKLKAIIVPNNGVSQIAQYCAVHNCDLKYFSIGDNVKSCSFPMCQGSFVDKLILSETHEVTSSSGLAVSYSAIKYVWYKKPTVSSYTVTSVGYMNLCLDKIPIYDNLTSLGSSAFYYSGLKKISLPPNLTSISSSCFYGCKALTDIYCYPHTPPTLGNTSVFNSTNKYLKIHVYPEDLEAYQTATNWSTYASNIVGDLEGEFKDGYCE